MGTIERRFKKHDKNNTFNQYKSIKDYLSVEDGLILYGSRILIPKSSRKDVLAKLHMSHQGVERTKRRARQTVYWPGIINDIATTIQSCNSCQERQPSQCKEPMMTDLEPTMIFEDVSCDFFSYGGHEYLVYADRYSGWPVLFHFQHGNTKTRHLIQSLRKCFSDLGVPKQLRSDGGPQFTSRELRIFLEKFGVLHVRSTPHYAQSNGHAEAAVKAMKTLVAKTTSGGNLDTDEFHLGLLEWRNTP